MKEEIELELAMLRQHLDSFRPLRMAVFLRPPDTVELMALAAALHAFYNGIENTLKRIAVHLDAGLPRGEAWHQRLLASMAEPGLKRPAAISAELRHTLRGYLNFRHFFRQAYSFQLKWDRMSALVRDCENTLARLDAEMDAFIQATRATQSGAQ
ncbi:MAG: hypothetical protein FJ272_03985 [Planctomycetes bacterium]|nr:hypothetical protein [Planctomycetota bacterium]MBM4083929.1 hypothetical protein [Planctomycetota bacterium]